MIRLLFFNIHFKKLLLTYLNLMFTSIYSNIKDKNSNINEKSSIEVFY